MNPIKNSQKNNAVFKPRCFFIQIILSLSLLIYRLNAFFSYIVLLILILRGHLLRNAVEFIMIFLLSELFLCFFVHAASPITDYIHAL